MGRTRAENVADRHPCCTTHTYTTVGDDGTLYASTTRQPYVEEVLVIPKKEGALGHLRHTCKYTHIQ
jgi:hypothetical protein